MLQFRQNDANVSILLTLKELTSLSIPYYLFVFRHVLTKREVKIIKADSDDLSGYQERYNEFEIQPVILFDGEPEGEWHYVVYEQSSSSNMDPALSDAVLEYGKLMLDRAEDFGYKIYGAETTFKTYNG